MKYFIKNLGDGNGAMVYTHATKPETVVADATMVETSPELAVKRWMSETFHCQIVVRSADQERFGVWHVDFSLK